MFRRARIIVTIALLLALPAAAQAALTAYNQNFESLDQASLTALADDGWKVFGNVYSADHLTYYYGYGTFPAPNDGAAFCAIAIGEGGPEQGNQQLSIYNDYNNADHALGRIIESNTFREQTIEAADVGNTWTFQFDAKLGNLTPPSIAFAFIKTLDPNAGWATTHLVKYMTTAIPITWQTYSISLPITADLVGQVLQIGFADETTNYLPSGVFYDNLDWHVTGTTDVPRGFAAGMELRPAAPNPFQGSTRLDFSLAREGDAEVGVFDVSGRRVATLFHGRAAAGLQSVAWNGRTEDGSPAPAGVYHVVLRNADGRVTRTLVLTR